MKMKYKITLFILGILIVGTTYTGVTYSLWLQTFESEEANTIKTGCFEIQFEPKSQSLSLKNTYPVSDSKALNSLKPYTIKITNTCATTDAGYAITLNTLDTTQLEDTNVKFAIGIDGVKPQNGNTLDETEINTETENITAIYTNLKTSYILKTGVLEKNNDSKTFDIYLWIDEGAGNEVAKQNLEAAVVVTSYATKISTLESVIQSENLATNSQSGIAEISTSEEDYEYRYVGSNPKNYLEWNNELWRIIGLVNTNNGKKIKIVKAQSLHETTPINDTYVPFSNTTLGTYLQGSYFNSITAKDKEMVETVNFPIGSASLEETFASWREKELANTIESTIGLPTVSDYGYATSGGTTPRETCYTTKVNAYSQTDCMTNNWMFHSKNEWLLNQNDSNYFYITEEGNINQNTPENTYQDRPVVYIKTGLSVMGGSGAKTNPYILK